MRKLVNVLVVLAAVCFFFACLACFGSGVWPGPLHGLVPRFSPETYWRGATGLLLFAITLILLERNQGSTALERPSGPPRKRR